MGMIFQTLISHGHKLEDLKYNYSVDQVYLFYENCRKKELEDYRMQAIIEAQAGVYTSPCYSRTDVQKRQRTWDKFISALDWGKLLDNVEKKDPERMFNSSGVYVKKKGE